MSDQTRSLESCMLTINRGINIPHDAVDAGSYNDLPGAFNWVMQNSLHQEFEHLDRVQALATEFPLLAGAEIEYWEAKTEDLASSGLSVRDQQALTANFLTQPCGVLVYPVPKLIIGPTLNECPESEQDMMIRHELVHLEQAVRGDTLLVDEGQIWKGSLYPIDYIYDINGGLYNNNPHATYLYFTLPWEAEAFRRSEGDEAYDDKLRFVHLAHLIHERLPDIGESHSFQLSSAASHIAGFGRELAERNEIIASQSGEYLTDIFNAASYEMTNSQGEGSWQFILSLLELDPDITQLHDLDDAWAVLMQASDAFLKYRASSENN